MNIHDIDLDISALLEKVPEDQVAFYFRASDSEDKDFAYAKGDLTDMSEALCNIMDQSQELADMILAAAGNYFKE